MLRIINLSKLFNRKNPLGFENSSQLLLRVEFSFKANAQVAYRDESNNMKIKRFCAQSWEVNLMSSKLKNLLAELKVFVYTPALQKNEDVKLSIMIDGQVMEEKIYPIEMEQDHAGWFILSHQLSQ